MEKITQTEQDYLIFKLLVSESNEGMSFVKKNNETVSKFLNKLGSETFEAVCAQFFKLDDEKIDRTESIILKWLREIRQNGDRINVLVKEVEKYPIYNS